MSNQLEYEMRQSQMLRGASLKIKRDYVDLMHKLYDDEYSGDGTYEDAAAEWGLIISDFFIDSDIRLYTMYIEKARRNKVNLWEQQRWKRHMRIVLPYQFRKRMREYTQVPRLATMSIPPEEKKKKEIEDW
jgi:hypothetical protein